MYSLSNILATSCKVCGVTTNEVVGRNKSPMTNMARGLYYVVALGEGYHPTIIASFINRSRPSCLIAMKRYRGYIYIKDKYVCGLYGKIRDLLKEKQNE